MWRFPFFLRGEAQENSLFLLEYHHRNCKSHLSGLTALLKLGGGKVTIIVRFNPSIREMASGPGNAASGVAPEASSVVSIIQKLRETKCKDVESLKAFARSISSNEVSATDVIDDNLLEAILHGFDVRFSEELRTLTTVILAKYISSAREKAETKLTGLFSSKLDSRKYTLYDDDFIIMFSALAALFPLIPAVSVGAFTKKEFMELVRDKINTFPRGQKVTVIQEDSNGEGDEDEVTRWVETALLILFSSACIDRNCRATIAKEFREWLLNAKSLIDDKNNSLAAVVLVKIGGDNGPDNSPGAPEAANSSDGKLQDFVEQFKGLVIQSETPKTSSDLSSSSFSGLTNALEGLAYSSVQPPVKEQLAHDPSFLSTLIKALKAHLLSTATIFSGLMIVYNLTLYQPVLSEEQKKMRELKMYANAKAQKSRTPTQGPAALDPRDDDAHVQSRCDALVKVGIVGFIIEFCRTMASNRLSITTGMREIIAKIMLALSKNQKTRGQMTQQGAVKLLLSFINWDKAASSSNGEAVADDANSQGAPSEDKICFAAAHALARVLISLNPSLVFNPNGSPQITSAIHALAPLLEPYDTSFNPSFLQSGPDTGVRDLLPVFETLMALTNIASYPDPIAAETIIKLVWAEPGDENARRQPPSEKLEDLLLSKNTYIQRAACELVCNLIALSPTGFTKFLPTGANHDRNPRYSQRLHILLALSDVDDDPTRSAASGALAILTEHPPVVERLLGFERGIEIILRLCEEENEGVLHRGLVCVDNMVSANKTAGEKFRNAGAVEKVTASLKRVKDRTVLAVGVETMKALVA